jgi:hypothetical protein
LKLSNEIDPKLSAQINNLPARLRSLFHVAFHKSNRSGGLCRKPIADKHCDFHARLERFSFEPTSSGRNKINLCRTGRQKESNHVAEYAAPMELGKL